ncbi:MAG TPA: epoxyqueuosine reductase [Clostridium sp.]|nr:epoxyqueuosine reductase [Clostridium sp.]
MEFHKELSNKLIEWGASFVGFSNVEKSLSDSLKKLKYSITVGVRLSDFIIDEIEDKPTYTYFHHYRTVNTLIDQITLKGQLLIQDKGYKALGVPASQTVNDMEDAYSGIFPHKTAAVMAGLGWIGKSGLFISNEYGPRVRLGTILTDMNIPIKNSVLKSGCGECKECVVNCPAMAITGASWEVGCERSSIIDAKACSDYMKEKFKHIGRGSVCGICIKVCPKGLNFI